MGVAAAPGPSDRGYLPLSAGSTFRRCCRRLAPRLSLLELQSRWGEGGGWDRQGEEEKAAAEAAERRKEAAAQQA